MASGFWKNALLFLGLVEEYDDDDFIDVPDENEETYETNDELPASSVHSNVRRIPTSAPDDEIDPSYDRTVDLPRSRNVDPALVESTGTVNVLGQERDRSNEPRIVDHVYIIRPTTFNDVQEIGERFRRGAPVVMDLNSASEGAAKRLLDFASGLIYGLEGGIDRTAERVFLLTPKNVDIASTEMDRLRDLGLVQ